MVDMIGIQSVFWIRGALLAGSGMLVLIVLGSHDFQQQQPDLIKE